MVVYLDIDGVLLTRKGLHPARHLKEFLLAITQGNDAYWLTSHCKGDAAAVLRHLRQYLPPDVLALLRCVKPTAWTTLKTEAINFNCWEFCWFDDYLLDAEKTVLRNRGRLASWICVNLDTNPDALLECVRLFTPPISAH